LRCDSDKSDPVPSNEGELFIVATPIGNLADISARAIDTLSNCDYIAVEDTRHSRILLNHLGIQTRLVSLHEHNERQKSARIIEDCVQGKKVALISDAGTPLISDPGYFLVRESLKSLIKVTPIPGACAAIAALSCSGMPSDRFTFEGFLPAKNSAREKKLKALRFETRTLIFYESTHRLIDSLHSMTLVFGEQRQVTLAKELTKTHETLWFGQMSQLVPWLEEVPARKKGEFVLIVEGTNEEDPSAIKQISDEELIVRLLQDLPVKSASQLAADLTGKRKKHFYNLALTAKQMNR